MTLTMFAVAIIAGCGTAIAIEIGCNLADRRAERRFKAAMRANRAARPRVIDSPTFAAAIRTASAQLSAHRHAATAPAIAQAIQSARPALPALPATAPDMSLPDDRAAFAAPPALRRPVLLLENPKA